MNTSDAKVPWRPSKFENTFMRLSSDLYPFRERLCQYLGHDETLRLRLLSRMIRRLLGYQHYRMFRKLYVQAPLPEPSTMTFLLTAAAPYCEDLTIIVGSANASQQPILSGPSSRLSHRMQEFTEAVTQKLLEIGLDAESRRDSGNSATTTLKSLMSTVVGGPSSRSSLSSSEKEALERQLRKERQDAEITNWHTFLTYFGRIKSLTLCIHGDATWPGRTEVEDTVVSLRCAIEQSYLPKLQTFEAAPVHAMGIIHLQWNCFSAFGQALASRTEVWQQIETLDLRIRYPSAVDKAKQLMFKQLLYNYLDSFAPSLRCLRLVWVGAEGPSPLALDYEPGIDDRPAIEWPKLEELWLGNTSHMDLTIRSISELAPSVITTKRLRPTWRESWKVDATDADAWIEIVPPSGSPCAMVSQRHLLRSSSIYSQDSALSSVPWAGGVSRTSREVPFIRDF